VLTRVTHETEVRGTETRVERVVERAPKPSLPDVDRASTGRGRYVYCIIRASQPLRFGAIGMDEQWADVYTINYKDMAAVVSDVPIAPLDSTRENVLAHERVNETVMREHTVIPMSFGTIFKTREDIVELLRSAADAFGDVLTKMQNKLEFGLKVLWDRDQAIRELENDDEDIGRLKQEISAQNGPTYFARMQYGRLIDAGARTHAGTAGGDGRPQARSRACGRRRVGAVDRHQPWQVRVLHHRGGRAAPIRVDRHRGGSERGAHRALPEPRRRRLRCANRGARLHAREHPRARARERDGDA
jgi:hypothetical protein